VETPAAGFPDQINGRVHCFGVHSTILDILEQKQNK
jgi:hypothetical protein